MTGGGADKPGPAATAMRPETDRICVGAIAGAFGVRGEARLKSFTADPRAIANYGPLFTQDGRSFTLRLTRVGKDELIGFLTGLPTREAVEAMRGQRLYVDRAQLPALAEDEFYHADLIGMEARDLTGAVIGTVALVDDYGGGDFLEIHRKGQKPLLVPFTRAVVPHVDLQARVLTIDPPAGLLDDEEAPGA